MTTVRTKQIEYKGPRRVPFTDHFCIRCRKDMALNQACRWVHCVDGGMFVLHPDDEKNYKTDAGDMGCWPVGLDCAKKIGLEWTFEGGKT